MPNYHLSAKVISRSAGRSATASAAYRAGERIEDRRTGLVHDYSRRGGVVGREVILPENAPERFRDRRELWNSAELAETRKNSQVAREVEVSLPRELSRDDQMELVRGFVREQFVAHGMCADVCFHDRGDGNPHAHIMLTTRECDASGFTAKNRDWNDRERLREWRGGWEREQNRFLERQYERERTPEDEREYVDSRSYLDRGDERVPERHMGPRIASIEREERERCELEGRDYRPVTDRGAEVMRVREMNREIARIRDRIRDFTRELRDRLLDRDHTEADRRADERARAEGLHDRGYRSDSRDPSVRRVEDRLDRDADLRCRQLRAIERGDNRERNRLGRDIERNADRMERDLDRVPEGQERDRLDEAIESRYELRDDRARLMERADARDRTEGDDRRGNARDDRDGHDEGHDGDLDRSHEPPERDRDRDDDDPRYERRGEARDARDDRDDDRDDRDEGHSHEQPERDRGRDDDDDPRYDRRGNARDDRDGHDEGHDDDLDHGHEPPERDVDPHEDDWWDYYYRR